MHRARCVLNLDNLVWACGQSGHAAHHFCRVVLHQAVEGNKSQLGVGGATRRVELQRLSKGLHCRNRKELLPACEKTKAVPAVEEALSWPSVTLALSS